jgi:mono/diheme cytochrome c family protein
MKRALLAILALLVIAGFFGYQFFRTNLQVELPAYPQAEKTVWLEQNWTDAQRDWFHHADQGTLTFGIPYEWLVALDQPVIALAPGLLADPAYLDRFGFIPPSGRATAEALPVGFARGGPMPQQNGDPWLNPVTGKPFTGVGLTCAACHTGRLTYQGTEILVDGAPALTNLDKFRTALGLSLLFTRWVPFRFDHFADRVLGPSAGAPARQALHAQLLTVLDQVANIHALDDAVKAQSVSEGFARLDAINRIGNTVFALDMGRKGNYVGTSAPVHYPRIWDASWFDWVQYNASIEQPMVRNAGEALGVSAGVNLVGGKLPLYASTVQVQTIYDLEQLLAGKQPDENSGFNGLKSPAWPAILPPIDTKLADAGAALYGQMCQKCHLAPVTSHDFWASPQWLPPNAAGERLLHVEPVPIAHIGTDPAQAVGMAQRTVITAPALNLGTDKFGEALGKVVENTVNFWYDHQTPPTPEADRARMNGNRPNGIQAPLAYKVRPLNGIWATPPYLHNGSVPTLYALLSPVAERPTRFTLGGREYDPVNVGYRTDPLPGGFELDTAIPGNLNAGHEFSNDTGRPGIIGPLLTPDQRRALVEYLKTL